MCCIVIQQENDILDGHNCRQGTGRSCCRLCLDSGKSTVYCCYKLRLCGGEDTGCSFCDSRWDLLNDNFNDIDIDDLDNVVARRNNGGW
jgi:hypothetical protein